MNTSTALRPVAALTATAVWVPALAISILPMFMSVMMFDAPGSDENPWTWVIVGGTVSLPVLCGISIVSSWLAWYFTRDALPERLRFGKTLRLIIGLLPVLSLVVITFGVAMLQLRCHGSFSCQP